MLPAYIIEELLKRERDRKRPSKEVYVELPMIDDDYEPNPEDIEPDGDDGIAIIDFSI